MKQQFAQPLRHIAFWMTLVSLVVLATLVAACGDSATATTSSSSQTASGSKTVVTITIAEKTGGHDIYSFDPQTVTIKTGTTIKWVNHSDENHLLASSPSGVLTSSSIVPRSGSNDNAYSMTFNSAGTYTITSTLVQREHNQPEGATSQATVTITVTQ